MSRFKIGDKVKINAHPSGHNSEYNETPNYINVWVPVMDNRVGHEAVIVDIDEYGIYFEEDGYGYPPDSLEIL